MLACTQHIYLPSKGLKNSTEIRIPCRKASVLLCEPTLGEVATSQCHSSNLSSVLLLTSSPHSMSFLALQRSVAAQGHYWQANRGTGRRTDQPMDRPAARRCPALSSPKQVHGERVEQRERGKRRARLSAFTSAVKSKDFYTQRPPLEKRCGESTLSKSNEKVVAKSRLKRWQRYPPH